MAVAVTQIHLLAGTAPTQVNLPGTGRIARTQALTGKSPVQANPSGDGAISDGIVVEAALTTSIVRTIASRNPATPERRNGSRPSWKSFRTAGNAIEVPESRSDLSATPTKTNARRYTLIPPGASIG